jgi:hypothetical protein
MSRGRDDQPLRGRHKKSTSRETKKWEQVSAGTAWLSSGSTEEELDHAMIEFSPAPKPETDPSPVCPQRPPWMSEANYQVLLELRGELQT